MTCSGLGDVIIKFMGFATNLTKTVTEFELKYHLAHVNGVNVSLSSTIV